MHVHDHGWAAIPTLSAISSCKAFCYLVVAILLTIKSFNCCD